MAETAEGTGLEALVKRLEALPTESLEPQNSCLEALLLDLAAVFREAIVGSTGSVVNAQGLGSRACQALLRLPVTLFSEAVASAYWEVARFNATRRINASLVLEVARRLADASSLLCSTQWRRKAFTLSASTHCIAANYAVAVEHAWEALTMAKAIGDRGGIAAGWINLGTTLAGAGFHQAGLRCFEIALDEVRDSVSETCDLSRTAALNNIALSGLYLGFFDRGLRAAQAARELVQDDSSLRALTSRCIGGRYLVRLLLETGQLERGRAVCNTLLEDVSKLESMALVAEVQTVDGLCSVFEGDVRMGLEQVRRGLDVLRSLQVELRDGLMVAVRAHEVAGHASAADTYRRELALHNRLVQQEGMLEQHRSHLRRLQTEEGRPPATLEQQAEMVERLAITTEMREDPSGLGVFRVGSLARLLAKELGWSEADAEALEVAARLHDVGKLSVANEIVSARRPLTADEMPTMHGHCQAGAEFLLQTGLENARLAADVATYHHEAWDGSGYPHGIGGTAIPLAARIVAIADAFDAMIGGRPYRSRLGIDEALAQLQAGAGTRHDPVLVPRFVALVRHLRDTVDDLDRYLTEAADRSPFMQVHRQLMRRLAEPGS